MPPSTVHFQSGKKARSLSYIFSSLCLIHCLMMPFVILLIPALSSFFNDTLELLLILLIIPVSAYAFFPTWKNHKNIKLIILFLLGIGLVLFSQFGLEHVHLTTIEQIFSFNENSRDFLLRTLFLFGGVIIISITVYRNNKHTHVCHNPHHHH